MKRVLFRNGYIGSHDQLARQDGKGHIRSYADILATNDRFSLLLIKIEGTTT